MKIAIMQPYFFPYIGYFQLINSVDRFVFYDDVNFIKQGWINRNQILLNGEVHLFTIPLKNISSFRTIKETMLHPTLYPVWKNKFLQTLKQGYNKAPYYFDVYNLVEHVLDISVDHTIASLSKNSIKKVCEYLSFRSEFVESSDKYENLNLNSADRVLAICNLESANTYTNMIGGKKLYDANLFNKKGVCLNFMKAQILPYKQFHFPFTGGLSIIDVLMFNDKERVLELINSKLTYNE